ncbi:MAG: cyclic nucleotide-binding domain-containing protein [Candidatus Wallbacteria bacterium]|nr:cyclic nucleotide-binding domain-containing protein [Candidatus Wallbacteria bacterium]
MSNTGTFWSVIFCMEGGAPRDALVAAFEPPVHAQAIDPEDDVLGLLAHASPDLLLFASPTGANLGLLKSIRAGQPGLAIVALALGSTLASEGFLERLGELAVTRFIELPIDAAELRRRVVSFLDQGQGVSAAPASPKRFFRAGELVFMENDLARECYLLNTGRIQLARALNRHTLSPVAAVEAGSVFGESALMEGERRNCTAVALEDSIATALTRDTFSHVMRALPAFALELLDLFIRRLSETRRRADPTASPDDEYWFHREAAHYSVRPVLPLEPDQMELQPGEVLAMPGSSPQALYWIVDGQILVESHAIGSLEAPPASVLGADSPVGEVAFLTGDALDVGAVAATRSRVAVIPRERFVAMIAGRPAIVLKLVQSLASRCRALEESLGSRAVFELA